MMLMTGKIFPCRQLKTWRGKPLIRRDCCTESINSYYKMGHYKTYHDVPLIQLKKTNTKKLEQLQILKVRKLFEDHLVNKSSQSLDLNYHKRPPHPHIHQVWYPDCTNVLDISFSKPVIKKKVHVFKSILTLQQLFMQLTFNLMIKKYTYFSVQVFFNVTQGWVIPHEMVKNH